MPINKLWWNLDNPHLRIVFIIEIPTSLCESNGLVNYLYFHKHLVANELIIFIIAIHNIWSEKGVMIATMAIRSEEGFSQLQQSKEKDT